MDGPERDEVILSHVAWARKLALATRRRRQLRIAPDDCIGAAYVALVEAAIRYVPGPTPFDAFAYMRVVGSVLDLSNSEFSSYGRDKEGRRRWLASTVDMDLVSWRLADTGPGPLELAESSQVRALFVHAMPRAREVLTAVYVDGMNLAEVGARMGISESRACQLAAAGVKRIRQELTKLPRRAPLLSTSQGLTSEDGKIVEEKKER